MVGFGRTGHFFGFQHFEGWQRETSKPNPILRKGRVTLIFIVAGIRKSNLKYSIMYPKQTKTTLLSPLNCRCCAGHRDFRQGPHRLVHAALHGRSHSEAFNGLRVSGLWVQGLRVWGPGFRVLDLGCLGCRGGSLEFSFSGSLNMNPRALGVVRFPGLVRCSSF